MRKPHVLEMPRKIVAVDFDGTLVHNKYPYCENPNYELIEFIKNNRDKYYWILWTMREGIQLELALKYLKDECGLVFDAVNDNLKVMKEKYGNNPRKVFADYYIDDRNATLETLKNL